MQTRSAFPRHSPRSGHRPALGRAVGWAGRAQPTSQPRREHRVRPETSSVTRPSTHTSDTARTQRCALTLMPQRPSANTYWQVHDDRFFPIALSPGLYPQGCIPRAVSPSTRGRTHLPRSHRCSRDCGSCGQPLLSQVAWLADLWMTRGRWVWTRWSCCGRRRAVHRAGAEIQRLSTDEGESSTCCPRSVPSPGSCEGTLSIPIVFHNVGTTMGTNGLVTDR